MEELFDSLLGGEMPETGAEEILPDTNIDDPVNTDDGILGGKELDTGTQYVDNTFGTTGINTDDNPLINNEITTDGSEYILSNPSFAGTGADALGASAGVADNFLTAGSENNFLNPVDTPELDVSNDDVESLRDKSAGIEREVPGDQISFKGKVCPTRHGCSGATYCDHCGSDYPY